MVASGRLPTSVQYRLMPNGSSNAAGELLRLKLVPVAVAPVPSDSLIRVEFFNS